MNKSSQIFTGIFLIIIAIAGMWFWFSRSVPSNSQKQSAVKVIKTADPNLLDRTEVKEIIAKEINGSIPVEIKSEEV